MVSFFTDEHDTNMEEIRNVDLLNDPRPPSLLQRIIKDPQDDEPFCDEPPAPTSYDGKSVADWIKIIDSIYLPREERIRYCTMIYAFSNGGTFSMDMVPKSFGHMDLPKKLEEEAWIRSFQYIAKLLDLDWRYLKHEVIQETADALTKPDSEGRGPFFKKTDDGQYCFIDEVVHVAVNISYCNTKLYRGLSLSSPVFMYRYCYSIAQYQERAPCHKHRACVSVYSDESIVINTFMNELSNGHVYDTLANRLWLDVGFCKKFIKYLKDNEPESKKGDQIKKIFTAIDAKSTKDRPKSVLYCLIAQNPPRMHILEPFLTAMTKHCKEAFMQKQYEITLEYSCRKSLIDIYLLLVPNVKTLPFTFIRSAIIGGDSILLDRVLCHQTWDQNQLNKAMQWVAMSGKFEDYIRLKQSGAVPDQITLYESIVSKNVELFEDIIRDGVDVEAEVFDGRMAIHVAAEVGNSDVIELLLRRGIDLESRSKRNEVPMYIAIDNNHEDVAEHFLMRGADPNKRDYRGTTGLLRACAKGLYRLVERLMYVGSDVKDVESQGCNLLHKAYISGITEIIDFAKTQGFEDDSVDNNKNTTLHFAALSGNLNNFKNLLDKMPSLISASNVNGWGLVSCAAACGRWTIFEFLRKNGADMEQRTSEGLGIGELAERGRQMCLIGYHGYIEEYHELMTLSPIAEFDKIIDACKTL